MNDIIMKLINKTMIIDNDGNIHTNRYMLEQFAKHIINECNHITHKNSEDSIKIITQINNHFGID